MDVTKFKNHFLMSAISKPYDTVNIGAIADSGRGMQWRWPVRYRLRPGVLPPVSIFTLPEQLIIAPNRIGKENLHIYVVINNALIPEFAMSPERALPIIGQAYAIPSEVPYQAGAYGTL